MHSEEITLSVDFMQLRYVYEGNTGKSEYNQLYELKSSILSGYMGKTAKCWPSRKGAFTNLSFHFEGGARCFIRYGYCHKKYWSWITFNPAKMGEGDLHELSGHMTGLFEDGFNTVFANSQISRFDLALDAHGAYFDQYVYVEDSLRIEDTSRRAAGTIYLGSEGGPRNFAIYDKRKERQDVAGQVTSAPWLRVEARLCDPKRYRLAELDQVPNPFLHLQVLDRSLLSKSADPLHKQFQYGLHLGHGPSTLLTLYTAAERKALWSSLSALGPSWWSAEGVWELYPSAFSWLAHL